MQQRGCVLMAIGIKTKESFSGPCNVADLNSEDNCLHNNGESHHLTVYTSDMAAAEAFPFPRTDTFSSKQAENFWQMRNDGTYTDFTILTKDKAFKVNTCNISVICVHQK